MQTEMTTADRLYRDKDWIQATAGVANAGVALAIVDPDSIGWAKVASLLEDYGFIGFTAAEKDRVFDQIRANLGGDGDLPYWDSFTASAAHALSTCEAITGAAGDPYILQSDRAPEAAILKEVTDLNRIVGVSPLPEWYMRGEGPPSLTGWIRAPDGRIIACTNGSMRYHPQSRLAGRYYVGTVSVAPSAQGLGLGTLVTALLVRDGLRAFDATSVTAVAQPGNAPSRAMLARCGLRHDPSRATVILNRSGAFHTR